ncbi:WD repeat-containing protein on Y chromosome [Acyrthosiphon pisum]|uniref:WD repeat-containing protein on Y chromosome n=1 Tax=Acyrthosiphon pisum TaxID=7029 RepID=A0A8R2NJW2_ACYPI|nr:WD repeat-containing protein on Y chromosome [Acyrthosiphon pisum]
MPKLIPNKRIEYGENDGKIQYIDIVFFPNKIKQSQKEPDEAEYIAVSRSGKVVRYKSDMQWKTTHHTVSNVSSIAVNGLVGLPEFSVICLSVVGGQLLFYDMSSGQFKLCLIVELSTCSTATHLAHVHTYCERKKIGSSKIAVGDGEGGVSVVEFISSDKWNPFRDNLGDAHETPTYDFNQLVVGTRAQDQIPFRAYRYQGLHPKKVEQVVFYNKGRSFATVSMSNRKSMAQCLMMPEQCEARGSSPILPFIRYTPNAMGFSCVCAIRDTHLATGSMDKTVRLWDVTDQVSGPMDCITLMGHSWGVKRVSHNTVNGHLYSVSTECEIKVWDLHRNTCLLTFTGLTVAAEPNNNENWPFSVMHFNWFDQTIISVVGIDANSFMTVECNKPTVTGQEVSRPRDDKSHDTPVVRTLYNALYHVLISVSADSSISVWNLLTGVVIIKWSMAHTEEVYCEVLPVEITAANFDPSGGLLVTGAANGSIHMWDPNNGKCLTRLRIPSGGRISEVVWLPDKILVTGFDRRVTEFNDPLLQSKGKVWLSSHEEAVLSACVKLPSLFVTTSQAGVMGFWRLETGQLIKKYKARMRPDTRKSRNSSSASKSQMASSLGSKSQMSSISYVGSRIGETGGLETREEKLKRLNIKHTPREHYAAVATHFLRARPEDSNVGTLLMATRNGMVQIWCTYKVPKYVSQFMAIHIADDYVTSMVSDHKNEYLITSFESGYIKTWLVTNFGQPRHMIYSVDMPSLRLRFPYLMKMSFIGQAERAASKNMNGPLLVSAYRAHSQRINHIEYIEKLELIVSSSVDKMICVWTLAGHYVGTLGMEWPHISKSRPVNVLQFKIPADIQRQASFTTIQVLKDGVNSSLRSPAIWDKRELMKQQSDIRGKKGKRKLHYEKCPDLPLHDIHEDFLKTKTASIRRPVTIKVDELKPRIKIHKHVPLRELGTITDIPKLEKIKTELTPKENVVFFKK